MQEHYRAMIFYDFKAGLSQQECVQLLSLQDEQHAGKPRSAVIPDNMSAIRKLLMDNNSCTYQMIQKETDIGSAAPHKIDHE
ncbi:UNVERIFIED_CONTAM: hypothetical protein NCL1_43501 [Trichonephila clavipes]